MYEKLYDAMSGSAPSYIERIGLLPMPANTSLVRVHLTLCLLCGGYMTVYKALLLKMLTATG